MAIVGRKRRLTTRVNDENNENAINTDNSPPESDSENENPEPIPEENDEGEDLFDDGMMR